MENLHYCNERTICKSGKSTMPQMSNTGYCLRTRLYPNHPSLNPESTPFILPLTLCKVVSHPSYHPPRVAWSLNEWVTVKMHLIQCQTQSNTKFKNWKLLEKWWELDKRNTCVFEEINTLLFHIKKKIEIKIYKNRRNCTVQPKNSIDMYRNRFIY